MSPMIPSRWHPLFLPALGALSARAADITVNLRSRVAAFKGTGEWREVRLQQSVAVEKTAILICAMWDSHRCSGVNGLVVQYARVRYTA